MNPVVIAPSVLSMDYSQMEHQMEELNASNAQWLHFDVMDGHFVPNLTFGPDILKGMRKASDLVMDVHLMVTDPAAFVDPFIKAGADVITFHTEALDNDPQKVKELVQAIRQKGIKAGFTLRPATPIEPFEEVLDDVDLVLVMSVNPGFGGQSFMEDQLEKVRWLDKQRKEKGLTYRIEIDGGINDQTGQLAKAAGADTLVAGSYVFKGPIDEKVQSLL